MSKRIGEALVQMGVITPEQLDVALNSQLVHGGHLGTCLIELNYVDEESLGQVLGSIHRVPHAQAYQFVDLPDGVVRAVSSKLVERHRVVPIDIDDKVLHVAMINPHDLAAIDDMSSATGLRVQPLVSPEIRIVHAMEAYYGIPRTRRFIALSSVDDWSYVGKKREVPVPAVAAPAAAASASGSFPFQAPTAIDPALVANLAIGKARTTADPPAVSDESPRDHGDEQEAGAPENLREQVDAVSEALSRVDNIEALADAVLGCASHGLERSILFSVQQYRVRLWDWRGFGLDPGIASEIGFGLMDEPLFGLLAGNEWFHGSLPDDGDYEGLFAQLDLEMPNEILLVPAHVNDRLVAILYGDGGVEGTVGGWAGEYRRLTRKLEHALQLLICKRRILEA